MRDQAWWDALVADDRRMLWHPYTSMIDPLPAYPVRRAEGVHIELADGRKVVDGMSSWWAAIHGYNVPEVNAAAEDSLWRSVGAGGGRASARADRGERAPLGCGVH